MTPQHTVSKDPPWFGTVWTLFRQSLRVDISSPERLITPLFFAVVILLLFSFAIPELDPSIQSTIMIAQTQIAIFFALQLTFARAFESERHDRVFEHLKLSPIPASAFIVSKMLHILFIGALTMLSTAFMSTILQGQEPGLMFDPLKLLVAFLSLLGLTGLGVLLAAITLKADGQAVLFPLLYFPLAVPVLLSSTEAISQWVERPVWTETMGGWVTILVAFDAIYLTMAILLAPESDTN